MITKQCSSCRQEFPLDSFSRQTGTKDGRKYECIRCSRDRSARQYANNPAMLEKNKEWQQNNKEKHNEAAKKYYHSTTGRLGRSLNKALDALLGRKRESFFHLVGTSVSALVVHLAATLPEGHSLEDYQSKWLVGFVRTPDEGQLSNEEQVRQVFHWSNLCAREKSQISEDFGVSPSDDK